MFSSAEFAFPSEMFSGQLRRVEGLRFMPISELLNEGDRVIIGNDNSGIFGTVDSGALRPLTLSRQLAILWDGQSSFGKLSSLEMATLIRNGFRSAVPSSAYPRNLIILGKPGSGKGAIAKMWSQKFGVPIIPMGERLRKASQEDSDIALQIEGIHRGELVPSNIFLQILEKALSDSLATGGFILDGPPRKLNELEFVMQWAKDHGIFHDLFVVWVQVTDEIAKARIQQRYQQERRQDDNPNVVEKRFSEYALHTTAVIERLVQEYLKFSLLPIDGALGKDEMFRWLVNQVRPHVYIEVTNPAEAGGVSPATRDRIPIARDEEGKPYTVRYEAVNAMLLNEFLKAHRTIEQQKTTIAQLQSADAEQRQEINALAAAVKEQAAQIQKVSAQLAAASPSGGGLEVSNTAAKVVLNNP